MLKQQSDNTPSFIEGILVFLGIIFICSFLAVFEQKRMPACKFPYSFEWTLLTPTTTPPPLINSGVAYNTNSNEAVIFGGFSSKDNGSLSDETWIWDGDHWRYIKTDIRPAARVQTRMTYDEKRDKVVLFGGTHDPDVFNDTWEWDGKTWQLIKPLHAPPARCCHSMVYDAAQQKVLLYGGWNKNTGQFFDDVWLWDGKDWTETTCCNLPPASSHTMIEFSSKKEVIALNSVENSGMWVRNGNAWLNPIPYFPFSRQDGNFIYDSQHSRAILFGGVHKNEYRNDMLVFDGTDWAELCLPTIQPSPRYASVAFYDRKRGSIILFGGGQGDSIALDDMWELKLPEDLSTLIVRRIRTP
jgi:hypothetical protein